MPYEKAVAVMRLHKRVSPSFLQQELRISYSRAWDYVEQMEEEGLIRIERDAHGLCHFTILNTQPQEKER